MDLVRAGRKWPDGNSSVISRACLSEHEMSGLLL